MALLQKCQNNSQNIWRVDGRGRSGNNWTTELWNTMWPPANWNPFSQLCMKKSAFRFIRSSACGKPHLPFNSSVGKRIQVNEICLDHFGCATLLLIRKVAQTWLSCLTTVHTGSNISQYQSSIRLLSVNCISVDKKRCRSYIMFNTGRENRDIFITY